MKKAVFTLSIFLIVRIISAQIVIPSVYSDINTDENGKLYHQLSGKKFYAQEKTDYYTLKQMQANPTADAQGISFDFGDEKFFGKLYFGLINYEDSKYPMPVWFRSTSEIIGGKAHINIKKRLSGRYDMSDWEKNGYGTLSYRVSDNKGNLIYDGIVSFYYKNRKFELAETIIEGPFVNILTPESAVISFDLNKAAEADIYINGKKYTDGAVTKHHEIKVNNLKPNTEYIYEVKYGKLSQKYAFKTAHKKGDRKPFVFAYASDSRNGQGGGEHSLNGTNFYVMRKMAAAARLNDVAFMQFSGDLVNGYVTNKEDINLQYANWKRAVEPYAHYFPFVCALGNHEFTGVQFVDENGKWKGAVTKFPFETESSSAVFASNFVNPQNGPLSEDGSKYDPNPNKTDFPPYNETVFYYIYDNVAVIVLNSNYWYSPTLKHNPKTSGNLHAYLWISS